MSAALDSLKSAVPTPCRTTQCSRDNCSVSLDGVPKPNVMVDFDCDDLGLANATRCDYLFVSDAGKAVCVAPIELKGGGLSASAVVRQLRAGADFASQHLAHVQNFHFVPIIAHNGIRRAETRRLRATPLQFRGRRSLPRLLRCGAALAAHLPT